MANVEVVKPYVEKKIAEYLGVDQVSTDSDGDIPIRHGSVMYFARLLEGPTGPMLNVFSPLLGQIKKNAKLLERLNELNLSAPFVRFFWTADQVFCAIDLMAETLQAEEIANALGVVAWHADKLDDMLQKEFGGKRIFEEDAAAKPDTNPSGGGYM